MAQMTMATHATTKAHGEPTAPEVQAENLRKAERNVKAS